MLSYEWLAVLIIVPLIAGIVLFRHSKLKRERNAEQQQGISWLNSMRVLLANMQKHRGLTSRYLAGDVATNKDIAAIQSVISSEFTRIGKVGPWIHSNERWIGIADHWARLCTSFKNQTTESNLNQHNKLISNLLYLIEDTAETHHLRELSAHPEKVAYCWKELLIAAESIGQARALGSAIAATHNCDGVSRIRMTYLRNRIHETSSAVWTHLDVPSQTKSNVEKLLDTIDNRIMVDKPDMEPGTYFALATESLEGLLRQFDIEIGGLTTNVKG